MRLCMSLLDFLVKSFSVIRLCVKSILLLLMCLFFFLNLLLIFKGGSLFFFKILFSCFANFRLTSFCAKRSHALRTKFLLSFVSPVIYLQRNHDNRGILSVDQFCSGLVTNFSFKPLYTIMILFKQHAFSHCFLTFLNNIESKKYSLQMSQSLH